jgi:hypothetical protein
LSRSRRRRKPSLVLDRFLRAKPTSPSRVVPSNRRLGRFRNGSDTRRTAPNHPEVHRCGSSSADPHKWAGPTHYRPGRGEPQEIAIVQQDLRAEEIVVCREVHRWGERDVNESLRYCLWPFASGRLIRDLVYAVHHGVGGRES